MPKPSREYDAKAYSDGFSEWSARVARDPRVTDPALRFGALMIGATAYWPTRFVRVEDRTIQTRAGLSGEQVDAVVDLLVRLNYARRNGVSQDGRTELRLIVPSNAGASGGRG